MYFVPITNATLSSGETLKEKFLMGGKLPVTVIPDVTMIEILKRIIVYVEHMKFAS